MPFKEFDWINSLPIAKPSEILDFGIGDDAAVFDGEKWAISTDSLVENVHFDSSDSVAAIARKCVNVNLSDMAAMACEPLFFLFNLHRPNHFSEQNLNELNCALSDTLEKHKVQLIGGDTVSSGSNQLTLVGTVIGRPFHEKPVYRSGAKLEDIICVTGNGLGGSYPQRHLSFEPRLLWSKLLSKNCRLHSMMDISDGLLQDLRHILDQSCCGAQLDLWKIPIHAQIQEDPKSLQRALSDGEDFELLFTLAENELKCIPDEVQYHRIGRMTDEVGKIVGRKSPSQQSEELSVRGYSHDEV